MKIVVTLGGRVSYKGKDYRDGDVIEVSDDDVELASAWITSGAARKAEKEKKDAAN